MYDRSDLIGPAPDTSIQYLAFFGNVAVTDGLQFGAAGGTGDVLTVHILHHNLLGIMAVTVEKDVDAAGMLNDIDVSPGTALILKSAVGHDVNKVSPFGAGAVYGTLNRGVNGFAGLVQHKGIDIITGFILEMRGRGAADCFRSGDAHKSDFEAGGFLDHIGIENPLALICDIAADIRIIR